MSFLELQKATTTKERFKLSDPMLHVLKRMNEGWELGIARTYTTRYWLQENGIARGGASERVHALTPWALQQRRLIDTRKSVKYRNLTRLKFTPKGRSVIKKLKEEGSL